MSSGQTSTGPTIGIVDYANVAPLVCGVHPRRLRRGLPRDVAAWLASGEVDIGLVPVIALGLDPELAASHRNMCDACGASNWM